MQSFLFIDTQIYNNENLDNSLRNAIVSCNKPHNILSS